MGIVVNPKGRKGGHGIESPALNLVLSVLFGDIAMPFYEYRCQSCGHEFEAMQKISDAPLLTCPACKADALQKLLSAPAFRLKGGGWYETDFKSGNKRNLHDSGSDSGKAEKTKPESAAATESKSAPEKTTAKPSASGDTKST